MSSKFEPTPEQRNVIESDDHPLIVSAVAGSGKTRVLVERYLRHVSELGLRPEEILTITFTRKAAAEMKVRIVTGLMQRGLEDQAQAAETGPIQTIHSFCERLLRENALESRLDPEFEVLSEFHALQMLFESVRDVVEDPSQDDPQVRQVIKHLVGKWAFGNRLNPYARLEEGVHSLLNTVRGSGVDREEFLLAHSDPEAYRRTWEHFIQGRLTDEVKASFELQPGDISTRLRKAFKLVTNKVPKWLSGTLSEDAERENAVYTCGLARLAYEAWWRLESKMSALQQLDFIELEARAVRLLEHSPQTRKRVRERYKLVMVDEAQDLNPVQYRLINAMQPDRLMMVGDPQQSIYAFRHADRSLFEREANQRGIPLSKNHRSEPGVLGFIDSVFQHHWNAYVQMGPCKPLDLDDPSSLEFGGVEFWEAETRGLDETLTAGLIQELLDEGASPQEIGVLVRDAKGATRVFDALAELGVEARIAGGTDRFFTQMEVRDLANALTALANPYDDLALLACLRSPMVGLSLDSFALLAARRPVVESMQEFQPPTDEDRERLARFLGWYEPLRMYADRLSAWEVISRIFADSDYLEALALRRNARQTLANVRKLLALSAEEPGLGPLEYADRIREIQLIRHKEGEAPASSEDEKVVTIMTIHKAKGLEFPIVVLPQTDRPIAARPQEVLFDRDAGFAATDLSSSPKSVPFLYLNCLRDSRELEEEMRVLYVALTRAKKTLCISLYTPGNKATLSSKLREAIGKTPPPGVRVRRPEPN